MEKTDWFRPNVKPVHVGWYDSQIFDGGFLYDWRIWWDGRLWKEQPGGWALMDQQQTWRGMTKQSEDA